MSSAVHSTPTATSSHLVIFPVDATTNLEHERRLLAEHRIHDAFDVGEEVNDKFKGRPLGENQGAIAIHISHPHGDAVIAAMVGCANLLRLLESVEDEA